QDSAPVGGGRLAPRPLFESLARSLDRKVNVSLVGFGDGGDDFAGRGIHGFKTLARNSLAPLAINQKLGRTVVGGEWFDCSCHWYLLSDSASIDLVLRDGNNPR